MESVLEQLATDMAGKAIIGVVPNTERELFKTFEIRGIPAFLVVYKSEPRQSYKGFRNKEFLAKSLRQYVGN